MSDGIGPAFDPAQLSLLNDRVARNPQDLVARHNLAVELRRADRAEEGLQHILAAWRGGLRKGETAQMLGNLLADAGRFDEAVAAYREAARLKPELTEPHSLLASLLPQLGLSDPPLASFGGALRAMPDNGPLWVQALATARAIGDYARLLQWTQAAESRWGPDSLIRTFRAIALSALDRDAEALAMLDQVIANERSFLSAHTTRAHVLLRMGDPAGAATSARKAIEIDPSQQLAWALLGTAWRLLDDPREHWLCDYEACILTFDVPLDPGLPEALEQRHRTAAHPPDQSLRGGTQTRGNLFETRDPLVLAAANSLRSAVEQGLGALPHDPDHPFLSRNTGRVRFPTSWSVRLASSGRHVDHIHPVGWMSSAYYVALPAEIGAQSGQGCLTFGVPDASLKLDLSPRRVIVPKEGRLVVFPSYLWHGTTPFESAQPRLTMAFDMLPVDNTAPGA